MRVFVILCAVIAALVVVGVRIRPREPAVSNVLFGFALVAAAMLVAAFFGWV